MSVDSNPDISGARSLQSKDRKDTNNSMESIHLLSAFIKWVSPSITPDRMSRVVLWFFSGDLERGTEYQFAIKRRLEPLIPIFVESNSDLTFADKDGKTILHFCISYMHNYDEVDNYRKKHDSILVTTLCKWGAQIIANDNQGFTPLGMALIKRRMDLVKTLVRVGYTTSINSLGQNILHILISEYSNHKIDRKNQSKIIRDLLSKRADFNKPDRDGATPAHLAAMSLNTKVLKMFEKNEDYLISRTNVGDDLLILVCRNIKKQTNKSEALQLISWLLNQGFNVNSKNNNNFTPLHYASQSHQLAVVKTLVEAGADLHAVACDGTNCVHSATMSDSFKIMQYLIECGVKSNLPDKVYGFILMHMAAFSYNEEIFEWLAKNGFDLNDNVHCNFTPLHLASMAGNDKLIKKLIKHGADVNLQEKTYHYTALHFASMGGQFATIQKINAKRLNVDNIDDNFSLVGFSFTRLRLQRASEADYKSTIDVLLEAGANVNAKGFCNSTPLHYAIQQPNSNLVETLLKAGAHVDVQDNKSFAPLHNSLLIDNEQGLKYLLMFGANINDIEHPCREIHKEIKKSNYSVKSYVLRHLVKLKVAHLTINDVFKPYFNHEALKEHYIMYLRELIKLKERMLAPNVSLYDLLHMNFRYRVKFVDSLPSDLETEFPCYYILIKGKCNEAVNRNELLEPAKKAFGNLTGIQWPGLCVDHILMFLNNSTLRVLIDGDRKYCFNGTKQRIYKVLKN